MYLFGYSYVTFYHLPMYRDALTDYTEGVPSSDKDPSSNEVHSSSTDETDGIPISATQGSGVKALWDKIEKTVLRATGRQHIKFNVPSDGLQLRYCHSQILFA